MRKYYILFMSFVAVATIVYLSSCKNKKPAAKTISYSYTSDINKIITAYCMPCHNSAKHRQNMDLSTYENVKTAAMNKNFLGSIKHEAGYKEMPMEHEKLDDATIEKISWWVQNGTPK